MKAWESASPPRIAVSWSQDKSRRVVHISGHLTCETSAHLESSIVGVGARRLVLDLDAVEEIDDTCAEVLVDLIGRLADGQVDVIPPSALLNRAESKPPDQGLQPLAQAQPAQMGDPVAKSV